LGKLKGKKLRFIYTLKDASDPAAYECTAFEEDLSNISYGRRSKSRVDPKLKTQVSAELPQSDYEPFLVFIRSFST
jgi:hypothetical protein